MIVEQKPPPMALMRLLNPVMRVLLPTRLGRRMRPLAILEVTGRRSGRLHRIPVGAHPVDDGVVIFTDRPWRENVRGGADVVLAVGGTRRPAVAELVDDPAIVGPALSAAVAVAGPRRLGLALQPGAIATVADYGAVGKSMIRVRF